LQDRSAAPALRAEQWEKKRIVTLDINVLLDPADFLSQLTPTP